MEDTVMTFLSNISTNSLKFNLYLKTHELKEVSKILESVALLPEKERKAWAEEHGEMLNRALDSFVQASNETLSDLTMDEETLQLSKELILSLRDTVDMAHGILFERTKLTS